MWALSLRKVLVPYYIYIICRSISSFLYIPAAWQLFFFGLCYLTIVRRFASYLWHRLSTCHSQLAHTHIRTLDWLIYLSRGWNLLYFKGFVPHYIRACCRRLSASAESAAAAFNELLRTVPTHLTFASAASREKNSKLNAKNSTKKKHKVPETKTTKN